MAIQSSDTVKAPHKARYAALAGPFPASKKPARWFGFAGR